MKDKKKQARLRNARRMEERRHRKYRPPPGPSRKFSVATLLAESPELRQLWDRFGRTVPEGTPPVDEARAMLHKVLQAERPEDPVVVACALLQLSRAHLAAGQPLEAKAPLAEAERLFEQNADRLPPNRRGIIPPWQMTVEWVKVQIHFSLGRIPEPPPAPPENGDPRVTEMDRTGGVHRTAYIFRHFAMVWYLSRDYPQQRKEAGALAELLVTMLNEDQPDEEMVQAYGHLFQHIIARISTRAEDEVIMDAIRNYSTGIEEESAYNQGHDSPQP